jgi:hypothetical protein
MNTGTTKEHSSTASVREIADTQQERDLSTVRRSKMKVGYAAFEKQISSLPLRRKRPSARCAAAYSPAAQR